jgi:hypothetical protein
MIFKKDNVIKFESGVVGIVLDIDKDLVQLQYILEENTEDGPDHNKYWYHIRQFILVQIYNNLEEYKAANL